MTISLSLRVTTLPAILAAVLLTAVGALGQQAFTDTRDRKSYRTVSVGGQNWMAENLNYAAGGSKCYGNKPENCEKYGRLYDWKTARTACPAGWRLPSDADWNKLIANAGDPLTAGAKLKSPDGWSDYRGKSGECTDDYGFSAMPGGYGNSGGGFGGAGDEGYWWTSTESSANYAWYRYMLYHNARVRRDDNNKAYLHSVRCVQ